MMNWLYYLLEANLYLAVFYGCYRLLLHKETFYVANRFFLILSTLMAFSLPLLKIGYLNQLFASSIEPQSTGILVSSNSNEPDFSQLNMAIYTLYCGIAILFSLKLIRDIYRIFLLSKSAKSYQKDNITYVSLNQQNAAFSFFNLLFIQSDIQGKETILKHELVHIRQGHSLDILFFEIVQILNWFNPISYLIKKDIKLIHEYIADEETTLKEIGKYDYALFLIKNSFGTEANPLSNHIFNQSILKQRINMLNKEKSTGRARLKILFALPIAAAMLGISTMAFTKDYSLVDLYPEKTTRSIGAAEVTKPISVSGFQEPVKTKAPPAPPAKPNSKPTQKVDNLKFPPPIVRPDKKTGKKTKTKVDNIKFPPPIVKPDRKAAPPAVTYSITAEEKPAQNPTEEKPQAMAVEQLNPNYKPEKYDPKILKAKGVKPEPKITP